MIPKYIHYCWLSDAPIPKNLQICIETWHKLLPDYEFIKWDFNRFPRGKSQWVDDAFSKGKYAFAADYIRLYALYNYGGIYLDSDVEVIKPFDDFLDLNDMVCYENSSRKGLEVAVLGVEPKREWIKLCLDYYIDRPFDMGNGILDTKVLPEIVKETITQNGWKLCDVNSILEAKTINTEKSIPILPFDFFSPKSYETGQISLTENTHSIHHFAASWHGRKEKLYKLSGIIVGKRNAKILADFIKRILTH